MRSEHCRLPQRARHQAQDLILRKVAGRHQRKSIPENVTETARTVLHIMVTDTADGTTDTATAKDACLAVINVTVEETDKKYYEEKRKWDKVIILSVKTVVFRLAHL